MQSMKSQQQIKTTSTEEGEEKSSRRWKKEEVMLVLFPVAMAIVIYCNSLTGQFVHDDLSAITANSDVTGGSWSDFLFNDFWGTNMNDPRSHKSYRPLTILTFKWNYALSGLNPSSYHVVNVLLHGAVVFLVAVVCRQCLRLSPITSSLASFLFAIHPIHTEAVAGIVGRADILTTLFFLVSFISHDRGLRCLSLISALLALGAKENGIAALPVAITWDIFIIHSSGGGGESNKSNLSVLVSIVTTCVLLLTRIVLLQGGELPTFSEQDNPAAFAHDPISRILTLVYLPAFNMGLLLAPVALSYDWQNGSIPLVQHWTEWRNVASILFYSSLASALAYSWLRRKRVMIWALAVIIWPMLPASNLFYPCGFVVAERLLYLPSVGYCVILSVGLTRLFHNYKKKRRNCILMAMTVISCCLFGAKTWTRNADWADRKTLFQSGLKTLPNNAKMWYNYGNVQKDEGRWQSAIDHYRQAIELWPNYASALNNLGTVLLARAEESDDDALVEEAEGRFHQAIRYHPHHLHAHYNLAVLYMRRNETKQSMLMIRRCLTLNPHHREAINLMQSINNSNSNAKLNQETTATSLPVVGEGTAGATLHHHHPPPYRLPPQLQEQESAAAAANNNNNNYRRWNKTA